MPEIANKKKAFECHQKSAEMAHADGTYMNGYCYESEIKASNCYQKSTGVGHGNEIFDVSQDEMNSKKNVGTLCIEQAHKIVVNEKETAKSMQWILRS